jgi:8-oxo-dGTP pyrophosphatase MutT (NUDIX family)
MSQKPEVWKRIESREIADCRVFKVREDLSEKDNENLRSTFYVLENPDWVNVIALTRDHQIVLIDQFRHGIEEIITEIPGGMVDRDETAEQAARRELLEETGYTAEEFVLLGYSRPNPAIQNNTIYHFLALDAEKTGEAAFDEHENLVARLVPMMMIPQMIKSGEISHSLVVAAFQYFSFYWFKV